MEEFFIKYKAAFDALDPEFIASLYRLPCAISDADGVQTFTDNASLIGKFERNCEAMRNFGYQQAKFNIISHNQLAKNEILVDVGWRVVTTDTNIDFRTLYICHKIDHAWFIFSANVYPGGFGIGRV